MKMQKQEIQVGMVVSFGRAHGEHTVGKVVKVNREKVKVQQLQDRGVLRSYPVGTIWSVPASLLSPADPTPVKAVLDVPLPRGVERFIEGDEPMVDTVPASVKVASTPTPEAPVSASPTKTPKASAKAKASPHKTRKRGRPVGSKNAAKANVTAAPPAHRPTIQDPVSGFRFQGNPGESLLHFGRRMRSLLAANSPTGKAPKGQTANEARN